MTALAIIAMISTRLEPGDAGMRIIPSERPDSHCDWRHCRLTD